MFLPIQKMTEAEVFTIPVKKRKLEDEEGIRIFDFDGSDRLIFHDTSLALSTVIGDYIRGINTETALKQADIVQEATKQKTQYTTTLKYIYKDIMAAVEVKVKEGGILDHGITVSAGDSWKGKQPIIAAFQCVKRELHEKGWSPEVREDLEETRSTGSYVWHIFINCSFQ